MKTTMDKKSEHKNIVKVSVVIPTYNRPDTLKRAITSVLSQTCADFEIIIVNDSHHERPVWDIINHFADEKIRYFRNKRTKGGNGARNTGIIKSKGEYIAFLDDDDEWLPDKLYLQLKKIETLDSSWGGCYCGYSLQQGKYWINFTDLKEGNFLNEFLLNLNHIGASSTLMIKKEAFKKVGLFEESLIRFQDIHFLVCFFRHYKLAYINEILTKVFGHNPPNPVKFERTKMQLFKLIQTDIAKLGKNKANLYYAIQYRELSLHFACNGYRKKCLYYLFKSLSFKVLRPDKYIKIGLAMLDGLLNVNTVEVLNWINQKNRKIKQSA